MKFNPNVTIYIGDFKLNPDSHQFVTQWDERILGRSLRLIRAIPVVDLDYLGLDQGVLKKIVHEASNELIVCTLYPNKVDNTLPCKITYKENIVNIQDQLIWNIIRECFFEPNRAKLSQKLKDCNISPHVLNLWLQGNPTPETIGLLKQLDSKVLLSNPDIWIDYMCLKLKGGPTYPKYKFKKKS
jgi:hypothetical protein